MSALRDPVCDGCGTQLSPVEAMSWHVCLPCTRARHKAVLAGHCVCGRRRKPGPLAQQAGRTWTPCLRCLGVIQTSRRNT